MYLRSDRTSKCRPKYLSTHSGSITKISFSNEANGGLDIPRDGIFEASASEGISVYASLVGEKIYSTDRMAQKANILTRNGHESDPPYVGPQSNKNYIFYARMLLSLII